MKDVFLRNKENYVTTDLAPASYKVAKQSTCVTEKYTQVWIVSKSIVVSKYVCGYTVFVICAHKVGKYSCAPQAKKCLTYTKKKLFLSSS